MNTRLRLHAMDNAAPDENLLLIVEDSFLISGRGRVLAPGLPTTTNWTIKRGDPVKLIRPDGEVAETTIQGFDAVHSRRAERPEILLFITLPKSITADEVSKGTRVVLNAVEGPLQP